MSGATTLSLAAAASALAVGHAFAPDHWVPFAAIGRARRWPAARTVRLTLAAGALHVSVTAALGVAALATGSALLAAWGERLTGIAGTLLVLFGLAYAVAGLRHASLGRLHRHGGAHVHADGSIHAPHDRLLDARGLLLVFAADPCVAMLPLLAAAAPLGRAAVTVVFASYALATLATMVALVVPAHAGAAALHAPRVERWMHAAAGGAIAGVGVLVARTGW